MWSPKEADKDNDGNISPKEFEAMVKDGTILFWLASIGLDIADAKLFFDLMLTTSEKKDDVDALVPIPIFVQGCMRMKGGATSIDLQALSKRKRLKGSATAADQQGGGGGGGGLTGDDSDPFQFEFLSYCSGIALYTPNNMFVFCHKGEGRRGGERGGWVGWTHITQHDAA